MESIGATRVEPRPVGHVISIAVPSGAVPAQLFWLNRAVNGLRHARPEFSAASGLWPWQRRMLAVLILLAPALAPSAPPAAFAAVLVVMGLPFFCVVLIRSYALWNIIKAPASASGLGSITTPVWPVAPESLPSYSILVALYREADVAPALVQAMAALDYPQNKLEIVFITEADDDETRAALDTSGMTANMRVLVVPEGAPQTKPRALNFALAAASGDMIAVYDAEDIPEPDQLLHAVAAFHSSPVPLACVQARLNVYNGGASLAARQFMLEYTALFDAILPALACLGLPLPLGGTSNHFRREDLEAAGGWDPFNVTEDADLGFRLARLGKTVGLIDSTTWEEAPVTIRGWLGQRTRWLKGWMQTYLVHMRQPKRLLAELGIKRFLGFQVLMAGLILSALVHPLFLGVVLLKLHGGTLFAAPGGELSRLVLGFGLCNLMASYVSTMALSAVTSRRRGRGSLIASSFLTPLYWLAISVAAWRALFELCWAPYHWEKTAHGARPVTTGLAAP